MRIVLVEDHTLLRQSVARVLTSRAGIEVVGEAGTVAEGLVVVARERPDVAIVDVTLPDGNGLDLARAIHDSAPEVRTLVLTMHEDDATITRAVDADVDGFVTKAVSPEELFHVLETIVGGAPYLTPSIARRVMALASTRSQGAVSQLTRRELEILRLLASGARPQEIARRLSLSIKTVKNYCTSIYSKLGVETGAQAVAEAYRRQLVQAS